ncbi:MAG: hypothetical protein ACREUG_03425 [Steroidobacteraceae bacterium]
MAIEHARICGACERECPSWAVRCPACGSLSLLHRITFVSAAAVAAPHASAGFVVRSTVEPAANGAADVAKPARKSAARSRTVAARDTKLRKTPLSGEPETRAV